MTHLYGVSFTDPTTGTAVGGNGTILRTTDGGATWIEQASGINDDLFAVSFADAGAGTAAGDNGTILHTTNGGTAWVRRSSGTTNLLRGLRFIDGHTGTVVGFAGTILRTTDGGVAWEAKEGPVKRRLYGLRFEPVDPAMEQLCGVAFNGARNGIAAGDDGAIMRATDGGLTWRMEPSVEDDLRGVSYAGADIATAVGVSGTILHSGNGGLAWTRQADGPTSDLERRSAPRTHGRKEIDWDQDVIVGIRVYVRSLIHASPESIAFRLDRETGKTTCEYSGLTISGGRDGGPSSEAYPPSTTTIRRTVFDSLAAWLKEHRTGFYGDAPSATTRWSDRVEIRAVEISGKARTATLFRDPRGAGEEFVKQIRHLYGNPYMLRHPENAVYD